MAKTLFNNVQIFDGSGDSLFRGEVLIEDNRIVAVVRTPGPLGGDGAEIFDGHGATLMPGLCDGHTHFSWINQPDLNSIGVLPVEEHVLAAMENVKTYIDCGYTMCVGAAAAKPRLDVVIRNAINKGQIPGPWYLANGPEISTVGGLGDLNPAHIPAYTFVEVINGPEEMRRTVRRLIKEGVDLLKLNLSGEEITSVGAEETPMAEDEIEMAVAEATAAAAGFADTRVAHSRSNCVCDTGSTSSTTQALPMKKHWTCSKRPRTSTSSYRHWPARANV